LPLEKVPVNPHRLNAARIIRLRAVHQVADRIPSCTNESMNLKTCNVESNFPSLDEARRMVLDEIRKSKREGVRALKIIHCRPTGIGSAPI
jgi:hypothetical protein